MDLKRIPTWQPVVAAAIVDSRGRVLMQKRPEEKHHGGLWEFPGGKVEPGESPAFALVREIEEELAIQIDAALLRPACFAQGAAEGSQPAIVILLYITDVWRGSPQAVEGGEWRWFTLDEAALLPKPPLDIDLLKGLAKFAE